ncbi:OmpA family protein [Maridesulfovibrio frigidus]|uniref:OmpA family protein n=1 Tax=Maridesulfovibrio frigidus TaxID=340956 RepID=UPI000691F503|nr:OmpA family protein [Maridesulfovibrio frigidus]
MKKILLLIICTLFLAGCGQTVVLLPDLDGHVGAVTVTMHDGETVVLDEPHQAVGTKPQSYVMSESEIEKTFSGALAAQPKRTERFLLYFYHDSTKMKPKSKKLLPAILEAYKDRSSTDVSVIGHTDAVGDNTYNYGLSLRRAQKISKMLMKQGIPDDQIQTVSHGEENPLIPTPDGHSQPKNRRVEVLVR